jgi:solute carrier family 25 carnitine/acylcarnitine transporter 20/29
VFYSSVRMRGLPTLGVILHFSYKSVSHVVQTIMKTTGPKAFINGIGPTLARAFPANAATFFAYETAMKAMA